MSIDIFSHDAAYSSNATGFYVVDLLFGTGFL